MEKTAEKKINKKEFIKRMKNKMDCSTKEAELAFSSFVKCLEELRSNEETFVINGFGRFQGQKTKERTIVLALGPDKGKTKKVSPKLKLKFKDNL